MAYGLGVGDVTGDSIPDIVLANSFMVTLFQGLGDGTFGPRQTAAFDTLRELDVVIGDVTGDGVLDLITSDISGQRLLVRSGRGDGTFDARIATALHINLLGLELADMNCDGRLDMVSLCKDVPGVVVALGDGTGRFGHPMLRVESALTLRGIAVGDVTGDGRPDVVATAGYQTSSSLVTLPNEGGRRYGAATITALLDPGISSPYWLHLADLNGDNRLDAVVEFGGSVQTALGNGNGTFQTPSSVTVPNGQSELVIADFNGDSIPDLVGSGASSLRFWPGLGDGTFGTPIDSPLPDAPRSIAAGDLNGDGIIDVGLVVGTLVSHALGAGDGTFAWDPTAWQHWPHLGGYSVVVGDITGDGRDDLIGMTAESPYCGTTLLCSRVATRIQSRRHFERVV
jgi:hypothetical protein